MRVLLPLSCALVCALAPLLPAPEPTVEPGATPEAQAEQPHLGVRPVLDEQGGGLRVDSVVSGSTAGAMGVQSGDVLTTLNGTALHAIDDLRTVLAATKVGDPVRLTLTRAGQAMQLSGTMQAAPSGTAKVDALQEEIQTAQNALLTNSQAQLQLAAALQRLSQTLEQLPRQLDVVAKEFKQIYPEGEFTVKVLIDIRTSKEDPGQQLDLSPQPAPAPALETPAP